MTLMKRVEIRCNWPHTGWQGCQETDWEYGINGTRLRKAVAQRGWLRVGALDFCGVDPDKDPYRAEPAPNHAALLVGHDFIATQHKDDTAPVYGMLRPGCSCGWVCPADALNLSLSTKGMVRQSSTALSVWLDVHVREDIAGLAPRYTREQFDAAKARAAEREAEWKEQHETHLAKAVVS